jgi:uncharacterized lipoprotein YmbA
MLFCIAILSGCIGGSSPAVRFYVLSPITPVETSTSAKSLAVEISTVHLPQYLDRPHIVTRSGDNRSQLLDTPNISIAPHRSSTQADYRVSIEVIKFEKDTDEHVRLSAQWQISSGIERTVLVTQISTLSSESPAPKDNYDEMVGMMSQQFGELGKLIAQSIQQLENK